MSHPEFSPKIASLEDLKVFWICSRPYFLS